MDRLGRAEAVAVSQLLAIGLNRVLRTVKTGNPGKLNGRNTHGRAILFQIQR